MNVTDGLAVEAKTKQEIPFADQDSDSSSEMDFANVLTSKLNRRKNNLNLRNKQSLAIKNTGPAVTKTKTMGGQARLRNAK